MSNKPLSDKDVTAFHRRSHADNVALREGRLSSKDFWDRVHIRDRQVRAMSREDRMRINDLACQCKACRMYHPDR